MAIKKEASDKFYQKIHLLAEEKKFPLKAMFELTYRCNFSCVHCYVVPDENKEELSTKEVKEILGQLKEAGCFHIGFSGGEPLIRDDIFQILDYAKKRGFRISLLTNGFLMDEEAADKIASLGTSLNRVDVSVLGANDETFEKLTRKKGSYKRVMRAIKLLKEREIDVQIKAPLMKPNKNEFWKIKGIAERFDTLFRYGPMITPRTNGDTSPCRLQVEPEEVFQIKRKLSKQKNIISEDLYKDVDYERVGRENLFRCGAGRSEVSISPYGEMNLCLEIHYPQYKILEGSFKEGWQKIKEFVENFKPSEEYFCRDCALSNFCHWCPARGWLESGDLNKCSRICQEIALVEARHSPYWKEIAPLWEKQKTKES